MSPGIATIRLKKGLSFENLRNVSTRKKTSAAFCKNVADFFSGREISTISPRRILLSEKSARGVASEKEFREMFGSIESEDCFTGFIRYARIALSEKRNRNKKSKMFLIFRARSLRIENEMSYMFLLM